MTPPGAALDKYSDLYLTCHEIVTSGCIDHSRMDPVMHSDQGSYRRKGNVCEWQAVAVAEYSSLSLHSRQRVCPLLQRPARLLLEKQPEAATTMGVCLCSSMYSQSLSTPVL